MKISLRLSKYNPSQEIVMATGDKAVGHHANKTIIAISADEPTVDGKIDQVRAACRAKNVARAQRRQCATKRRAATRRNLNPAFMDVGGVLITPNNPEANIYGAMLTLNDLPSTQELDKVKDPIPSPRDNRGHRDRGRDLSPQDNRDRYLEDHDDTGDLRQKINDNRNVRSVINGLYRELKELDYQDYHDCNFDRSDNYNSFSAIISWIRNGRWPDKFKPTDIDKFNSKHDSEEWLRIFSIVVQAVGGDDNDKINYYLVIWAAAAATCARRSRTSDPQEPWLAAHGDAARVFLAGDSAGGNIAHNATLRAGKSGGVLPGGARIEGLVLLHPYFGGEVLLPSEGDGGHRHVRRLTPERVWAFLCAGRYGIDHPFINPLAMPAGDWAALACRRVLVTVAEHDYMRDRGRRYVDALRGGSTCWEGEEAVLYETDGEDHIYFLEKARTSRQQDKVEKEMAAIASFIMDPSSKARLRPCPSASVRSMGFHAKL
ncbi:2-hydroxyisoflavanone dehydratase [Dichanthelium oligosanthes]|uniref:2-hydroxyisoflavanone dehydratase n=1 Tax=Dichanthelium oligosanthes TaxID=888268 RepID=A0A1E5WIZ2_9POAL|nr:2-hydroxyisoflavanone dehydratase [Dichanthelium oligosanthes]